MTPTERFLQQFTHGIIAAGGTSRFDEPTARAFAEVVWQELRSYGPAYPSLVEREEIRFIYQWDQFPAVLTLMIWDDKMWRDMARIIVPRDVR